MLQIASDIGIDEIVILGDYLDMYGLSLYEQDPAFGDPALLYDREIECGNLRLDELDKHFPKAKKKYLEGNHEFRMKKYLKKMAPAIRKRLTVVKELQLDKRNKWSWYPFTRLQSVQVMNTNLFARHCPPVGGAPGNVAKQSGGSVIYGHTHQTASDAFVSKVSGQVNHAINAGWLGNGKERVFDYVQGRPNWTTSFTIVYSLGKDFWYDIVRINNFKAVYNGKVYRA